MPQCACTTRAGTRCQHTARPGGRFCGNHVACARDSHDDVSPHDTAQQHTTAVHVATRALREQVDDLALERDFYYSKLLRIEALLGSDQSDAVVRRRVAAALTSRRG